MKLSLLLTILLLAASITSAQQFTIPELVKLRYQTLAQMDATLKQKGYTVVEEKKDTGWRLLVYRSIVSEDGKPVMRNVMISQVFDPVILEVEYGVWDKKEIDVLKDWLLKNGYKKGETYEFGNDLSTSYGKAGKSISIHTISSNKSSTPVGYRVHINNKDYK